ncbi:MAG TPA: histidine phosphatase family protein [Anaerolineae bacterium]|nr:histidine phosphatase family protein [Anaerolineae bacterium]
MQFYYIRHGQSANNQRYAQTGSAVGRSDDAELTEMGHHQAERVAAFLAAKSAGLAPDPDYQNVGGFGITHLYSSLMVRAVATGMAISRAVGIPLVGWKDWHETGGIFLADPETGEFIGQPGKPRAYLAEHYPDFVLPDDVAETGWWNRSFEAREERFPRAERVLRELLARHGGTEDRVALVSHGGFFNYILAAILRYPLENRPWFAMNNAAITRIDFKLESTEIIYVNRADFLPRDLIT